MWARIIPDKHEGCENLSITFSDSSSSHLKSKIDEWQWNFGDGNVQTLNSKTSPIHTYASPGIYKAYLIVKDNGRGLSQKQFEKVIKPKKDETKESEMALGLSISNVIFKEHGFEMSCDKREIGTEIKIKIK
jgi:PKD repeat protein